VASFVRRVPTASGARAVQIVHKQGRRVTGIEHIGSAHDDAELAVLMEIARQRLHEGQQVLEFSAGTAGAGLASARVAGMRCQLLWDVLSGAYSRLGFDALGDESFKALVLARIVEPTSKADTIRVLGELGVPAPSLRTIFRALARCIERDYRDALAKACRTHSASTTEGPASLVLYDVTVRREALVVRAEVRGLCRGPGRSRGREAGGSLTGETPGRVGAAPTKSCRVSTVGWRERGERTEEVYARNRCHHLS
jgi:hypothetical protein